MADTTIRIDTATRDRLAVLAADRGCTIGDLVASFAEKTLTREELEARHAAATRYIREHLVPDFGPADIDAGEQMWRDLEAGRLKKIG